MLYASPFHLYFTSSKLLIISFITYGYFPFACSLRLPSLLIIPCYTSNPFSYSFIIFILWFMTLLMLYSPFYLLTSLYISITYVGFMSSISLGIQYVIRSHAIPFFFILYVASYISSSLMFLHMVSLSMFILLLSLPSAPYSFFHSLFTYSFASFPYHISPFMLSYIWLGSRSLFYPIAFLLPSSIFHYRMFYRHL